MEGDDYHVLQSPEFVASYVDDMACRQAVSGGEARLTGRAAAEQRLVGGIDDLSTGHC